MEELPNGDAVEATGSTYLGDGRKVGDHVQLELLWLGFPSYANALVATIGGPLRLARGGGPICELVICLARFGTPQMSFE